MQPSIAYVKVDAVDDKPGVWIVSRNLVILTSAIPQLERANGLKGKGEKPPISLNGRAPWLTGLKYATAEIKKQRNIMG
uniref:START domain-containing protein n=1 Tax=Ascaris lumbricoides TaxID=6252 RepID=A0A0M3HP41_ASCLU